MSPLIPYPNVPNYPGVPAIPRKSAGSPSINVSLASAGQNAGITNAVEPVWGIFQTGTSTPLYSPSEGGTISVFTFGQEQATQVSDFPIEAPVGTTQGAGFASFNKVWRPTEVSVSLALSGSTTEKQQFLAALEAACSSTALYDAHTPDANYLGYTVERFSYRRSAIHNATMLTVEVQLRQILQVTASYTNTPVISPQSPSAANRANNGISQPQAPTSYLAKWFGDNSGDTLGVGGNSAQGVN